MKSDDGMLCLFNILPVEIFLQILRLSFSQEDQRGIQRLQQLASVFKAWYRAIDSFPDFWTTISSSYPKTIAVKLQKSGNQPIDVQLGNRNLSSPDHGDIKGVSDLVLAHSNRWSRFAYQGFSDNLIKDVFQKTNFDLLSELEIRFNGHPTLQIDQVQIPNLRDLIVEGINLPSSRGVISGLRSLCIRS